MGKFIFAMLMASLSSTTYASGFKLSSPDIKSHHMIAKRYTYNGFGCTGDNISPALKWKGAPKGTRSFALTVYDPDAPTGSGWWHWIVINIPANVHSLPENAGKAGGSGMPAGSEQMRTDFGIHAYGGPCPPKGDKPHHYVFTLYALKTAKLKVPKNASAALVGFMIHANMLGEARFVARYGRHK
jgi:Raf kinase inhibitor-like YbhB/YbcL family protein